MVNIRAKSIRRLMAAEGYLELGLPHRAHQELDAVDCDRHAHKYAAFLRGEALRSEGRYLEAIEHLEFAAKRIPAPYNQSVYRSLSLCYRASGDEELADVADSMSKDITMITVLPPPPDEQTGFER